jgi:uncharacterized membrane protein YqhA
MKLLERLFEGALWNSRFLVIIAVVMSLLTSIIMFVVAGADAIRLIGHLPPYLDPTTPDTVRTALHDQTLGRIATTIDGFLFATILLIFALGLYELFISKIDQVENSEFAKRILLIQSLDDLKDRLAKVIFLILVVKYFEFALEQHVEKPLDLLYLAIGITLIAASLYLTSKKSA